jgi:hypothetical protein
MSETNVQTVNQDALVDLFPDLGSIGAAGGEQKPKFGMQDGINTVDLFNKQAATSASTTEQTTEKPSDSTTNQTTEAPAGAATQTGEKTDADILGTTGIPPVSPSQIADLPTYYQDRVKNGKFIAVKDVDDKGQEIDFIPKTAEEYDEVLELQINYRLNEARKDLEKKWYESKSPAWKAVSQYAELVDDPTQLIPFLQGVKTLTSVANLDETDPDGAEQIVRTRLLQKGDPEELITQQIETLKTTDTLVKTAKVYKPIIIQQEQQQLQQQLRAKDEEDRQYKLLISDIRDNALKSIESPIFGKTKLKQEEKAAIYDLIAEPAEETQGYGIYNIVDQLFDKREFEKLKEVALLLTNREAFMNYLGAQVANATAASLERKLRLAGESRSSSGNDFHEESQQARVTRNQFKTKPSFGRG